jgi:hypothetical protein
VLQYWTNVLSTCTRIRGPAAGLLVWIIDKLYWLSVAALWFRRGWGKRAMFYAVQSSVAWNPICKLQRLVPSWASICRHFRVWPLLYTQWLLRSACGGVIPVSTTGHKEFLRWNILINWIVILWLIPPLNVTGECYLIFQRVLVRRVSCATSMLTGKPKRLQSSLRSRII